MALVRLIRNIVAQIGGILIVIIMLILLVKKIAYSKCEFEKKSVKCESWLEIAKTYQLCIERGIKTVRSGSLWNKLHLVVDMCKKLATLPLNVTYLANADDIKGLVGEERKKMRGKIEENSQLLPGSVC